MAGRNNLSGGARLVVAGLGLTLALLSSAGTAEARGHRHHARRFVQSRHFAQPRHAASVSSSPAFAAMVVDVNTGRTLFADHENELRHPASITKVMTLYLLFEKLDSGQLQLDSLLTVSHHAASQSPTKLGLRPGSTITVENAIKAIVTRSANDMAVAVAEAVGGDEDSFANLMTRKAHALGMSRTTYVNASGLPDDRQITTAHDLTILGRAVQDRFPGYYHYFSTSSFTYAGQVIANHNHLMERVEGMDGIKTGYTNASGFNLLSNVKRDGHHIVAVVMGGKSAAGRDRIMEGLIAEHLEEAAPTRIAGAIEERPSVEPPARTVEVADSESPADVPHDDSPSLIAPTMAVPPIPPRPSDRATTVGNDRVIASPSEKPRPAFVAGAPRSIDPARLPAPFGANDRRRLAMDGSTSSRSAGSQSTAVALATSTPSTLRWVTGQQAKSVSPARVTPPVRVAAAEDDTTQSIKPSASETRTSRSIGRETAALPSRGNWVIQIGATDSASAAVDLLDRAKSEGRSSLSAARPMTEKVQKGSATLYRARFAGLAPDQAEAACRTLKRSGFACFATHD